MVSGTVETSKKTTPNGRPPAKPKTPGMSAKRGMAKVVTEDKTRLAALELALGLIDKTFGKGAIMRLDGDATHVVPGIPTGALSLDLALGGRGLPRGRVAEIFGPESSGKTTLALTVISNAQRGGGVAAFIDAVDDGCMGSANRERSPPEQLDSFSADYGEFDFPSGKVFFNGARSLLNDVGVEASA